VLEALAVLVRYVTVYEDTPSSAAAGGHTPQQQLLPAQGGAQWLPLPPVAAAPPVAATGRQGWRPPPRLGAAGSPAAQVLCSKTRALPDLQHLSFASRTLAYVHVDLA
jgi:hypothetical protein